MVWIPIFVAANGIYILKQTKKNKTVLLGHKYFSVRRNWIKPKIKASSVIYLSKLEQPKLAIGESRSGSVQRSEVSYGNN